MFRNLMLVVTTLCCSNVALGADAVLCAMKTDGKTANIACTIHGSTNEAEIVKALAQMDAEIDISKAEVTKGEKNSWMITIKIPSEMPAFNMVQTETTVFAFVGSTAIERRTRTYTFTFKENDEERDEVKTAKKLEDFIKNTVQMKEGERSLCTRSPQSANVYSVVLRFDSK